MPRKITEAEKPEFIRMFNAKVPVREIMKHFSISHAEHELYVKKLRHNGVKLINRNPPRIPTELKEEIYFMSIGGKSAAEIARIKDMPYQTVKTIIEKAVSQFSVKTEPIKQTKPMKPVTYEDGLDVAMPSPLKKYPIVEY